MPKSYGSINEPLLNSSQVFDVPMLQTVSSAGCSSQADTASLSQTIDSLLTDGYSYFYKVLCTRLLICVCKKQTHISMPLRRAPFGPLLKHGVECWQEQVPIVFCKKKKKEYFHTSKAKAKEREKKDQSHPWFVYAHTSTAARCYTSICRSRSSSSACTYE